MSNLYNTKDIVAFARAGKPSSVKDAFSSIIAEKIEARKLDLKKSVAAGLFEATSEESEDDGKDKD